MIFGATMKTVFPFGRCSNKFCETSPSGKTLLPGQFARRNLEKIQVEGCKTSVCVQLHFGANFALAVRDGLGKLRACLDFHENTVISSNIEYCIIPKLYCRIIGIFWHTIVSMVRTPRRNGCFLIFVEIQG